MAFRRAPINLLEMNAALFAKRHSSSLNKIPQNEWQKIADQGFDAVWLMGVWKRSPAARQKALAEPNLRKAYDSVLPGWKEEDITGSPYAIYDYELEPFLGKTSDLEDLKKKLNQAGLQLFLDFVPNHLAIDHPFTKTHPEMFVQGTEDDPNGHFYTTPEGKIFAHGRDPYFPPWSDTVQVNYFSKTYRDFAVQTLLKIAAAADGVRCDMAMLGLSGIFQTTWESYLKISRPAGEFWKQVIPAVKKKFPKFIFMAEVYWDLESELQKLGFDYTYDKKLYDLLRHGQPADIRSHLRAESGFQKRSVRFIENHDEERAASAFGIHKSHAAAAVIATVPGLHFFHDGQLEGKKIHLPVQLGREPHEKTDEATAGFYEKLLSFTAAETFRRGQWQMLEPIAAGEANHTYSHLLCWAWSYRKQISLVTLNYSAHAAQGRIRFQSDWLKGGVVLLKDFFSGETYERSASEIEKQGLYVELGPWGIHGFEFKK